MHDSPKPGQFAAGVLAWSSTGGSPSQRLARTGSGGVAITSAGDYPQKCSGETSWGRGAQLHHRFFLSVGLSTRLWLSSNWGPDKAQGYTNDAHDLQTS